MNLSELAAAVERAADLPMPPPGPAPAEFGADLPGTLGELGARLSARWAEGLAARTGEAAEHREDLADTAAKLRRVAERYSLDG